MLSSTLILPFFRLIFLCSVLALALAEDHAPLSARKINLAWNQLPISQDAQNGLKSSWDNALDSVQLADDVTGQNMAPLVEEIAENVGLSFSNSPSPSATSTPTPSITPSITPTSSVTPSSSSTPSPSSKATKSPTASVTPTKTPSPTPSNIPPPLEEITIISNTFSVPDDDSEVKEEVELSESKDGSTFEPQVGDEVTLDNFQVDGDFSSDLAPTGRQLFSEKVLNRPVVRQTISYTYILLLCNGIEIKLRARIKCNGSLQPLITPKKIKTRTVQKSTENKATVKLIYKVVGPRGYKCKMVFKFSITYPIRPSPTPSSSPSPSMSQLLTPDLTQYTPNQADWSTFYSKPIEGKNTDHSPDGVWWLEGKWVPWDGTIYDPTKMSHDEFYEAICPRFDVIRGIYEVYSETKPFKDQKNPTKAEVDEWHRISMLHLRKLVGINAPFEKDHCLFARALWGQQRRFTRMWDTKYPDGNCEGSTNAHCGATFIPDAEDQKPYLPEGHPSCRRTAGSEGITGAPKSNIPWSIKWIRAFCSFLGQEGYNGGHVGPFWGRTKFGWSFWDNDPSNNNNNCVFRAKWSGPKVTPPWLLPTSSPIASEPAGSSPSTSASAYMSPSTSPSMSSSNSPQVSNSALPYPTMTPGLSPSATSSASASPVESMTSAATITPTPSGIVELTQYTPDQADWSTLYSKPLAVGNTDHSPDGVFWIDNWVSWDGTIYDPTKMSASAFKTAICPNANYIRGIYEVYQAHQPFQDPVNPTKAEVDEWHRISMLHLRKLVGAAAPLEKDHCLFARALWGEQRKHTRMWDTKYPDGNCEGSTNSHCGASFIPDSDDQKPYLPDGHPSCGNPDGSEGILPQGKTNIPWSIRWMRAFCTTLGLEGYNGGHVGPFWGRTKFGWSFWDKDPSDNNNFFAFRVKWGGTPVNPPWV